MFVQNVAFAALGLASMTLAALASFSPSSLTSNPPTYKVGIPSGSGISASSAGTIYFSLSAPSSYQWVGLGIGEQMRGSQIFVMYADGKGNVTISARAGGRGEVEPQFDSSLAQGVTLLSGSGDDGTTMIANVKCTTCKLSSAANSGNSPWIAAWVSGKALDSTSTSQDITQHGGSDRTAFTFDLSAAALSSDSNPFVSASGGSATSSGSNPTNTGSSSSGSDDSSDDSSSSSTVSFSQVITYQKAHGIVMGVTVVLLFPLGAMSMRLVGSPLIHAILQILSLACLIAGFGLGLKLAQMTDLLFKFNGKTHTIFGTVIVGLFLIQPFLGLIHHNFYKKYQARSTISHTHIWFGRIIMVLAVINGGLGLKLAANTKNGEIAYGVVAGVVGLIYIIVVAFKRKKTETRWMWNKERQSEVEMARRT